MERWKTHTKVELRKDVVNELIKMKVVGESYSDVIDRLIKWKKKEN
jgi:predicted CopG family antitoxin